jgi:sugar/nucleoside kinase (ribokinase family)
VLGEVDLSAWKNAVREVAPRALIAINIQGWIKCAGPPIEADEFPDAHLSGAKRVVQKFWDVSAEDFRGIDVACLSEEDVLAQPGLLDKLRASVPVVAFTRGAAGSRIYVDGTPTDVGIYPTDAQDPTGAGDVFAASFAHKIARGFEPVAAARFAAAAASIVVEERGARALHRLDEAAGRATRVKNHRSQTF